MERDLSLLRHRYILALTTQANGYAYRSPVDPHGYLSMGMESCLFQTIQSVTRLSRAGHPRYTRRRPLYTTLKKKQPLPIYFDDLPDVADCGKFYQSRSLGDQLNDPLEVDQRARMSYIRCITSAKSFETNEFSSFSKKREGDILLPCR